MEASNSQWKQCRTCYEWKDADEDFGWRPNTRGTPYPRTDCKECRQAALNARYASDPAYREACRRANRESAARRRAAGKGVSG